MRRAQRGVAKLDCVVCQIQARITATINGLKAVSMPLVRFQQKTDAVVELGAIRNLRSVHAVFPRFQHRAPLRLLGDRR